MDNIHIGGAFHSSEDYRDTLHGTDIALATAVPASYDADYSKIPVQMQNKIGICTAEAVCTLIEHFRNDGVVLSRRFTYMVGKKLIDGNTVEGSSIRSMLHGAYKYGTQPESVVPTDTTMSYADFINFDLPTPVNEGTAEKPDWRIYVNGVKSNKIPGYVNVPVDQLNDGVYQYGGLAVRFDCGDTWWTPSWAWQDIMPIKQPANVVSGHAVVFTAYDEQFDYLRNSWSVNWGKYGNGWAGYEPTEAWAISAIPVDVPKLPNPQAWRHMFSQDLEFGMMNNDEVRNLQTALSILGYIDKKYITGNYSVMTKAAVFQFQKDHVITDWASWIIVWANFGRYCSWRTRNALNKIFA